MALVSQMKKPFAFVLCNNITVFISDFIAAAAKETISFNRFINVGERFTKMALVVIATSNRDQWYRVIEGNISMRWEKFNNAKI